MNTREEKLSIKVALLNDSALVVSFVILCTFGVMYTRTHIHCDNNYLKLPNELIVVVSGLGFVLFSVSLTGCIARGFGLKWLLVHLLLMIVFILVLLAVTILVLVATNDANHSNWLQKRVSESQNWSRIKSCLIHAKFCNNVTEYPHLSVNQFGCCKPPKSCNLNSTKLSHGHSNPDCNAWHNNPTTLCFNCQSCKAAVLLNLKRNLRSLVTGIIIVFIVCLIVMWSFGFFAYYIYRWHNTYNRDPFAPN